MLTQHYKLTATKEHFQEAMSGQFVHISDDSDEIIGFIDFISDNEMAIMLFKPTEIPDNISAINISEECDYMTRLQEIFVENPVMRNYWMEIQQYAEWEQNESI